MVKANARRPPIDNRGSSINPIVIEHVSDDDNSMRQSARAVPPRHEVAVTAKTTKAKPSKTTAAPKQMESDADDSTRAIRGVRKNPASVNNSGNVSVKSKASFSSKVSSLSSQAPSVAPSQASSRASSRASSKATSQASSKASSRASSRVSAATKSTKTSTTSSVRSGKKKKPIDLTTLSADHDPQLEKELEEIALDSRAGMISGTPEKAAYDLEKGKQKAAKAEIPVEPKITRFAEDDGDKKGHAFLVDSSKSRDAQRKRIVLILITTGLLALTIGVLFTFMKKRGTAEPTISITSPLNGRQTAIQSVLEEVTSENILSDPTTPQNKARQFILFEDSLVYDLKESTIVQRYSLACLYYATGGPESWRENNWLNGNECGEQVWSGINCNHYGQVRTLVLDNMGLMGTMPPEIGHLSKLENLVLKNNPELVGFLPTELGHLKSLNQLGLYNNALSGVLPDFFEHTKQLKFLNLENNNLWGSIPLAIQKLENLETLVLSHNKLEGIIPIDQLAKTSVKYLGLSDNRLSSVIERSIKDVDTLEHLYLDNNQMKGRIPDNVGYLTRLKSLDLGNNQFSGTVPAVIGNLKSIDYLSLHDNKLKGELPKEFGHLTNMKTLNVASNELTGTIPNISNMIHLINLMVQSNQFTGTIPNAIQQLQSIKVLFLSSNQFSGEIPSNIHRLKRTLRGLYLSENQLSGSIPHELCDFAAMEALFLDNNELTGSIPECFGNMGELQQLFLFENQLTGTIPHSLEEMRHLTGLGLEHNDFEGEMPDEVCELVDTFNLDIWADCTDEFGSEPLLCSCCSVCCPGPFCV